MKNSKLLMLGLRATQKRNGGSFIDIKELNLWMRTLLWSLDQRHLSSHYFLFLSHIEKLWTNSGKTSLVKYLKECNRIVMCWTTGKFVTESIGIPIGIRRGLPTIIPGQLRLLMESKNVSVIRAVMTILSLYRIISIHSALKLSTITDPFKGISAVISESDILLIGKKFNKFGRINIDFSEDFKFHNIITAGCNFKTSTLSAPFDAFALRFSEVYEDFKTLCISWNLEYLLEQFEKEVSVVSSKLDQADIGVKYFIGKLSTKVEAAGKVRVFAITDWWSQNLLLPLHDKINLILKNIPQDGTFDQTRPLIDLTNRIGEGYMVSFDLSAATDRLPIDFQIQVLRYFIGESALNWANLLRNRDWILKQDHEGKDLNLKLRYSVGQPMGAYSSFAMLALSHHFIVQLAAYRSGLAPKRVWFEEYALLGDDIVIANQKVASHYLSIMRDLFGVEINLSKSLESETGVSEFAKRLFTPTGQLTAIGPKVILQSIRNVNYIPALFIDLMNKGVEFDFDALVRLFKDIPRDLKQIKKYSLVAILWSLVAPFGKIPSKVLLPLLADHNELSDKETGRLSTAVTHYVVQKHDELLASATKGAKDSFQNLQKLMLETRGQLTPDLIKNLPSTAFITWLYRFKHLDTEAKNRLKAYYFADEIYSQISQNREVLLENLPSIISKITPKITNEKDLYQDDLEKLIESGKTAFKLSTHVGRLLGLPNFNPELKKRLRSKV